MVYRIYVEKKSGFDNEARKLRKEIQDFLGIKSLKKIRVINRYDAEGIDEKLFQQAIKTVFSEPQVDDTFWDLSIKADEYVFAVEFLPGQFDQRASSAAECIQLISKGDRPEVRSAKVYIISGNLKGEEIETIKAHLINPVESREASLAEFDTLHVEYEIPKKVETVTGFIKMSEEDLVNFIKDRSLAMDLADLKMVQEYFAGLDKPRDPTITEIKVIDTYWSDHCRHTTFNTTIDNIRFQDPEVESAYREYLSVRSQLNRTKPVSLMDIGTIAAKYLKEKGLLDKLDESDEINACTVKIEVDVDGRKEPWLLLFKNETHNHPTEIEPFGGAATCIGGAIRDPLSGRSYVYSAMRVTGAGDPLVPVEETLEGKLPQRKLVGTAASGYSSYGNQIGLATCQVDEIYHPGYLAKRMEIGAVIAATPEENVRRVQPRDGDVVILLGGKTGRDGIGGATGSSKSHTVESLETCGAEVQKGNAPEERKLQRLFRNPEASKMILRCNDFGAGGVSVAIGELAPGLHVDLDKVPKKYAGLDGTELAISESQERMAVVVAPSDADRFISLANQENLESTVVARVTQEPYLRLDWNGKTIVDISREFLDTNGAEKHIDVDVSEARLIRKRRHKAAKIDFEETFRYLVEDLNVASKRGLSEMFDSTIGAGTVLMPFGGKKQRTPIQAMVNLISIDPERNNKEGAPKTNTASVMAYGFNPYISELSPYHGAYLAVVESVSKLIATGADFKDIYLSFQEYFEKLGKDSEKWGKPLAAILGAFVAQMDLGIAAIGGKDSMSGTYMDGERELNVPPTLVSFAVTTENAENIISPEFKGVGHQVLLLKPYYDYRIDILPEGESLKDLYGKVTKLIREGKIISCYTPGMGSAAEAVFKMAIGNDLGFTINPELDLEDFFDYRYGSFVVELADGVSYSDTLSYYRDMESVLLGETSEDRRIKYLDASTGREHVIPMDELIYRYENKLESVYPCNIEVSEIDKSTRDYVVDDNKFKEINSIYQDKNVGVISSKPRVLIPVFPGTNCEYDSARAFFEAGADVKTFIINNLSSDNVSRSVEDFAKEIGDSQIIFIPGGFSGGDEPDGSGKFITAFFRNPEIKEAVTELLDDRKGLMAGICNGFQALIKLGLVPYGKIMDTDVNCPTLTFNEIGRHQSKLVRTRISSNLSPWLRETKVGDIYTVPISHGEGRFIASDKVIEEMAKNGQIATQYVDLEGRVTGDIQFNPNGSYNAIEGITSLDGRIIGKMGHSERIGANLYKNVPGQFDMGMFRSAVKYFKE